ncbi:phage tail tape measure protein [Methylobacterium radiotolerans]|uniref:Gene transfer agent (GTA) orfg11 n=1 Tax=Methylobacterium radiotolerans (strain ATCC 27329 / DSM 1819 / JCM 2831 / NBRC 15690 / NCIMB 10815 / 0-1) TaxID=426355 RepID=B1LTY9_METRJ|nr:phage tail tape measure protein [Methylobacterium radiotolerans]ACB26933.1 gene transfer agent (GTA) orfg11 [Methylobacterium radiotolerans JCM 2831]GEM97994.1 tail protein [Methylobacterium radiotolerans]
MAETDAQADPQADDRIRQLETLDRLAQSFGRSLDTALTRGAASGRSLDGVLGTIGARLAGVAARAAAGPIQSGLTGLVGAMLGSGAETGFARGGVFRGGRVQPFAAGGVVAAPTYFPMAGGAGLMGEAGPEAILPLGRGPDGRLGVAAGGAPTRPVSVTVNIATPDPGAFRRSEAQVTASLARAVARGQRAT